MPLPHLCPVLGNILSASELSFYVTTLNRAHAMESQT